MDQLLSVFGPWLTLAIGILITMLVSVIRVNTRRPTQIATLITLIITFALGISRIPAATETYFSGAFEISALSQYTLCLFSALGILFTLGGSRYLTNEGLHLSDFYHLLMILILGASVLVAARDLIVIFIALEVMSLPAYTLAGFRRNDSRSNEAALKYFIIGGALGAVYLLGASFIFGATGTTQLGKIFAWSQSAGTVDYTLFYIGHILIMIAFLFKVAAVPFHFWKPDVYEGAPSLVTGIMATVITCAGFITLTRILHLPDLTRPEWANYASTLKQFIRVVAALSLIVGSVILVTQTNIKRMMAYSSISNTGYILLGLLASIAKPESIYSVWIYLVGYSITTAGIFILLCQASAKADSGTSLIDLTGLFKRSPFHTFMWVIFLFSMIGMPFTVGFFTKYFVFLAAVDSGEGFVTVIAAICAVVSAYAYLRPIGLMVMRDSDPSASEWTGSWVGRTVIVISAAAVVYWGVMPGSMIEILKGISLQ
jgi:NADH-quinone oxidoreductase subunit N